LFNQSAFTRYLLRKLCLIATLIETLTKAESYLTQKNIPTPRLEAQILFAHFLKLRRIDLFTQSDRPLSDAELDSLRDVVRRKATGEPTAYILGEQEFYGRIFSLTTEVLIPRPETEELVECIVKEKPQARHIVDLGSGSGCIGITLALELKSHRLTLVDISPQTLEIARLNTHAVAQCDFLEADFTHDGFTLDEEADIVVSNPPYVLPEEFADLNASVREFEPKLALVAENFEALHRSLLRAAYTNLKAGGLFALETHPQKTRDVAAWVASQGFVNVEIRNDLAARPHFIFARKP